MKIHKIIVTECKGRHLVNEFTGYTCKVRRADYFRNIFTPIEVLQHAFSPRRGTSQSVARDFNRRASAFAPSCNYLFRRASYCHYVDYFAKLRRSPGKITTSFILICLLFSLTGPATATPLLQTDGVTAQRNVIYCTAAGEALKMDLFLPRPGTGPAPVVVYVHGGSWVGGDKFEVGLAGDELARKGYVVASINYRLGPKYKWPAQIQDAKCAVRYLRASARQYNLDPNRIAAWGSSAGGHLAALLGLTEAMAGFDTGQYLDQSSRVQAVVDMFGPTDLNAFDPDKLSKGVGQAVFGVARDQPEARELLRRASPVTYAGSAKDVPFLILHGDKDSLVPLSQSQELYDRLVAAGSQAELVVVKNGEHGFRPTGGPIDPTTGQIRGMIDSFFDRTLANASAAAQTFPQTGKTLQGEFMRYWSSNGGLAQFGYPISAEMQEVSNTDGKTYTVQYFERAVFELHPENRAPYEVLLTLLGSMQYAQKYPDEAPGQVPNAAQGSMLFNETGKRIGGMFLDYWRANGGLARQGYPISDEFKEVSPVDGKTYTVQYFERAVFEWHPENKPPYQVLLSPLGTLRYDARYGTQQP